MMHFVYAIYDRKAQYYLPLFMARGDTDAIRGFMEAVKQPDLPISLYPADFELHALGSFDVESGLLDRVLPVRFLMSGLNALEQADAERRRYAAALGGSAEVRFDQAEDQSSPLSLSS